MLCKKLILATIDKNKKPKSTECKINEGKFCGSNSNI